MTNSGASSDPRPVRLNDLVENFSDLLQWHQGDHSATIRGLQTPELADPEHLIFVSNRDQMALAQTTKAVSAVVDPALKDLLPPGVTNVICSTQVLLAMARIGSRYFPIDWTRKPVGAGNLHPAAIIAASARLGENCVIGPGAVIGEDCELGDEVVIGANAVIEPRVRIGRGTRIHPLVFVGHSCRIGERCEIKPHSTIGGDGFGYAQDRAFNHFRINHYGRVILEDDVHIGAGVQIDRGTFADSRIGSGTKIDNHCHFGHNIVIGKNTLITGGMLAAGSVTIGGYCVFGGRTTIAGHLEIADKTRFGGLSGITKSVPEPGEYGGLPLQKMRDELKTRAALRKLPEALKTLQKITKHLGIE